MNVLIDYLTLSSKIHTGFDLLADLGLAEYSFLEMPGRFGWTSRHYYRGVSLYAGGDRDDVCLELSGAGCRTVEEASGHSFDWFKFFSALEPDIRSKDVNLSRVDIAGDDREGELNFSRFIPYCKHHRYICRARFRTWTDGDEQIIYFGSPQSDRRLRIYNKALEQDLDIQWVRVEMQMRDDNATSFVLNWLNKKDVGECYAGVLMDFIRFTRTTPEQHNHQRCETMPWWLNFVGRAAKCPQLYLDSKGYTLYDVRNFLERQASSSLRLWLDANNGDFSDIIHMIDGAKLNRRQELLLEHIRLEERKNNISDPTKISQGDIPD